MYLMNTSRCTAFRNMMLQARKGAAPAMYRDGITTDCINAQQYTRDRHTLREPIKRLLEQLLDSALRKQGPSKGSTVGVA